MIPEVTRQSACLVNYTRWNCARAVMRHNFIPSVKLLAVQVLLSFMNKFISRGSRRLHERPSAASIDGSITPVWTGQLFVMMIYRWPSWSELSEKAEASANQLLKPFA
jgi:hypothetical protein